jgi:soluble lytic murein transglycosylase-like protein/LysM repeat protein
MQARRNLRAAVVCGAILLLSGSVGSAHAQKLTSRQPSRATVPTAAVRKSVTHDLRGLGRTRNAGRRPVKVRVRVGDTLSTLAARFNISQEEILSLNLLASGAQLQPGQDILIPVNSSDSRNSTTAPVVATNIPETQPVQTSVGNRLRLTDGTTLDFEEAWENAQGVWYRREGVTHLIARNRVNAIERSSAVSKEEKREETTRAKVVNVNASEETSAPEPVWIYLVGGARVEADEVTETSAGAWYRRGSLSIFIDRVRIERIERERARPEDKPASAARRWSERGWSTGSPALDQLIRQNGARYNVDPYLIFCVMEQESHFNVRALSPKGAQGLMQLMPGTAARFGVRRPFDPAQNVMGGTRYLKMLLENFAGRVDLVLAGYNAGEGAVMKYGGRVPPYRETRDYVKKISLRYDLAAKRGHSDALQTQREK